MNRAKFESGFAILSDVRVPSPILANTWLNTQGGIQSRVSKMVFNDNEVVSCAVVQSILLGNRDFWSNVTQNSLSF